MPSLASGGRTSASSPASSRRTTTTGWMGRWMTRPWRFSSMATESTRNGMSSVTISTMECLERQPCSSNRGLYTLTLTSPGWRRWARRQWARTAP